MLLATAVLGYYAANHLGVNTDTSAMIASDLEWRQDYIRYRDEFPLRSNTIIVVASGETLALANSAAQQIDSRLDLRTDHIIDSFNPFSDPPMGTRGLLLLDESQLSELADNLAAAQPVIGSLRQQFELEAFLELLRLMVANDKVEESAALFRGIATTVDSVLGGNPRDLDWSTLTAPLTNSTKRMIMIKPVLDAGSPRPAKRALETVREVAQSVTDEYDGKVSFAMTGVVAVADDEFISVTNNIGRIGAIAFFSVAIVLVIAFRSARLILLSTVTLAAGLTGTAAFAAASVGDLNVISIAFAVLYIGLGIDFVFHYLLRIRERVAEGADVQTAAEDASGDVGASLVTCAVTTAAGFYAFIPTDFAGVAQLGLISGTGMFISLVTTLTLVPPLLVLLYPRGMTVSASTTPWRPGEALAGFLARNRYVVSVPIVFAGIGVLVFPQIRFESDPMRLLDADTESVRTFEELSRDSSTSPSSIAIVEDADAETADLVDELEALTTVARVMSIDSFEPGVPVSKQRIIADMGLLLGPEFPESAAERTVDVARAKQTTIELAEALQIAARDRQPQLAGLRDTFEKLQSRLDSASENERQLILDQLQSSLLGDLPRSVSLLSNQLRGAEANGATLPASFESRWRNKDYQVVEIIPSLDITNTDNATRFIDEVRGIATHATGRPVIYDQSGKTVLSAFRLAFLIAFVAVTALVWLFMRSLKYAAYVLLPIALAIAATAASMFFAGIALNFANVIALPLLLGIGVDSAIHILHRSRELVGSEISVLSTSTARALFFSAATTMLSLGSLALSTHRGMASMGVLLTIGLVWILVAVVVVLPTMVNSR